jgi:tRNA A-37 threonylcarbamoyl transferase component Bud32
VTSICALARDPALPHLPRALDAERMCREFARRLNCGTHAITACAIDRVRHKPGSKALISYRLTLRRAAGQDDCVQLLTARLYPVGDSSARFRKASRERLRRPAFGPPLMHVETLGMVVWAYPNERKLREIVTLENVPTLREEVLPPLVAAHWGKGASILQVERDIVHYVPEHGLAARVDVTLKSASGRRRLWRLFAKHYPDDEGHNTFRKMQRLWRSQARANGCLQMAKPVAYQPQRRILWQEALSGTTLADVLNSDPSWMPRAGRAIAALHQTRMRPERQLTLADLVARLQAARAMLHQALPGLALPLDAVVDRLLLQTTSLRFGRGATLHADLHPKNLFATRSAIALIDFDNVAFGPPLVDIGSMIAALYASALLDGGLPVRAQHKIASFLAGYRAHSPFAITAFELGWYTAAALIAERACRCITRLKAGRLEIVADLIDLADRCSAGEFAWLPQGDVHA